MGMYTGSRFRQLRAFRSVSIALGLLGGLLVGLGLVFLFDIPHPRYDESDAGTERQLPVGDG